MAGKIKHTQPEGYGISFLRHIRFTPVSFMNAKIFPLGIIALSIFLFALFLRLQVVVSQEHIFYSDDAIYAMLAQRFVEGEYLKIFHPYWSPGYPLIGSLFHLLVSDWETTMRLVNAVFGSLLAVFTFLLIVRYVNWSTAALSALAIATTTRIIGFNTNAWTESQYTTFIWIGLFFGYKLFAKPSKLYVVITPLIFGLAYLTRIEAMAKFGLFLVIFGSYHFFKQRKLWSNIKIIIIMATVFVLTILPYWAILSFKAGQLFTPTKLTVSRGPSHPMTVTTDHLSSLAQDSWSVDRPSFDSQFYNPPPTTLSFTKLASGFEDAYGVRLWGYINFVKSVFPPWGVALVVMGAILGLAIKSHRPFCLYILSFTTIYIFIQLWFSPAVDYRYMMWVLPALVILQAVAIDSSASLFSQKVFGATYFKPYLIAGLIIVLAAYNLTLFQKDFRPGTFSPSPLGNIKYIGHWIRDHTTITRPKIMARHEGVIWYAQGEIIYFPHTESTVGYDTVVKQIKYWKVDYVLVDRDIQEPDLLFLFDPSQVEPPLKHVHTFDNGAVLYLVDHSWFATPKAK